MKLKAKAKEMQRAEMEEARQREANETALLAIGPRKKMKMDAAGNFIGGSTASPAGANVGGGGPGTPGPSTSNPYNSSTPYNNTNSQSLLSNNNNSVGGGGSSQVNNSSHFSNSIFSTPFTSGGGKTPVRESFYSVGILCTDLFFPFLLLFLSSK